MSNLPAASATMTAAMADIPIIVEPNADAEERGRLKRRRQSSQHSPRRASSPSRGHDRNSGSRYRAHHRKHHRPSSLSPPTPAQNKTRRRSDAEPDHTFRGRARNRSASRGRARSLLEGDDDACVESEEDVKKSRKRSAPPSRHRVDEADLGGHVRRGRSYPNLYKEDRRDSKGESERQLHGVGIVDSTEAAAAPHIDGDQLH